MDRPKSSKKKSGEKKTENPLDRVKAAAQEHGPLSGAEGFAALMGLELTPAERAQLRKAVK